MAAALLAWRVSHPRWLAAFALVWGAFLPWFGLTQGRLLVGPLHWIVALTHLLVGGVAIAVGIRLAGALERQPGALTVSSLAGSRT